MAYDEKLAEKVRQLLQHRSDTEEKKMMGGLTFMVDGKMCLGIIQDDLMARIDPALYEEALQKNGCREMNFTGRPMKGFVFIGSEGTANSEDLSYWVGLALDYNKTAKSSKKQKT